jgi:hypothetical protein
MKKPITALIGLTTVSAVVAIIVAVLVMVIYPGAFRLTAPVLCPDDQPDAFVVWYSTTTGDGETSTNFTLFCMDERGEFTEIGSWKPLAVVFGSIAAGLVALAFLLAVIAALRASTRDVDATRLPGTVAGIPENTRIRAQGLIGQDQMIHAIKVIREDTGMGLREAKEVAEALRDGQHVPVSQPSYPEGPSYPDGYPTG